MRLKSGYIARLLLLSILSTSIQFPLQAQGQHLGNSRYPRVLSVVEDSAGNFLLLNLQSSNALAAPGIQYLPMPDGQTIMVADFYGLVWNEDSRIFRPAGSEISTVRVGQFQANPPIFRVSITSSNPASLKRLEFCCQPRSLLIKFPGQASAKQIARTAAPSPAVPAAKPANTSSKINSEKLAQAATKKTENTNAKAVVAPVTPPTAPPIARAKTTPTRIAPVTNPPFRPGGLYLSVAEEAPKSEQNPAAIMDPPTRIAENRVREPALSKVEAPARVTEAPARAIEPVKVADSPTPPLAADRVKTKEKLPPEAPDLQSSQKLAPVSSRDEKIKKDEKSKSKEREKIAELKEQKDQKEREEKEEKVLKESSEDESSSKSKHGLATRLKGLFHKQSEDSESASEDKSTAEERKKEKSITDFTNATQAAVEFSGKDPLKVKLKFESKVAFKEFKLSDPPRYVLDLEGLDFRYLATQEPEANPWLKSVRFGNPEENLARIVFDLNKEEVHVETASDASGKVLTLSLSNETSTPHLVSMKGRTVVLDAGHGGSDPGAQRGDIQEKAITLAITAKLKHYLEERGMRVLMTRSDDSFVSLEDRVKITNETRPNAFVSIHINSLETDRDIKGIETYYNTEQSRALADKIHCSLVDGLKVPDRSVRKARFYVVNHTEHPSVLAEVGFISNKDERDKLISSDYQNKIAESVGQGVILFLTNAADSGSPTVSAPAVQNWQANNRIVPILAKQGLSAVKQGSVETESSSKKKQLAQEQNRQN